MNVVFNWKQVTCIYNNTNNFFIIPTNFIFHNNICFTIDSEEYETNGGTPFLDMNYTGFGEVIEGFDVIDKIASVQKGRGDRPVEDIKMTKQERLAKIFAKPKFKLL